MNTSDNTFEVQDDRLYKVQLSKATQFLTQDGKQANFSNLANDFFAIVEGKIDLGQTATSTPIRFIAEKITIIGKLEK